MNYPSFVTKGVTPCSESNVDPDIFSPDPGMLNSEVVQDQIKQAKTVCATANNRGTPCPYLKECLNWALANPEERGVWGGTTDRERARTRRRSLDLTVRVR